MCQKSTKQPKQSRIPSKIKSPARSPRSKSPVSIISEVEESDVENYNVYLQDETPPDFVDTSSTGKHTPEQEELPDEIEWNMYEQVETNDIKIQECKNQTQVKMIGIPVLKKSKPSEQQDISKQPQDERYRSQQPMLRSEQNVEYSNRSVSSRPKSRTLQPQGIIQTPESTCCRSDQISQQSGKEIKTIFKQEDKWLKQQYEKELKGERIFEGEDKWCKAEEQKEKEQEPTPKENKKVSLKLLSRIQTAMEATKNTPTVQSPEIKTSGLRQCTSRKQWNYQISPVYPEQTEYNIQSTSTYTNSPSQYQTSCRRCTSDRNETPAPIDISQSSSSGRYYATSHSGDITPNWASSPSEFTIPPNLDMRSSPNWYTFNEHAQEIYDELENEKEIPRMEVEEELWRQKLDRSRKPQLKEKEYWELQVIIIKYLLIF